MDSCAFSLDLFEDQELARKFLCATCNCIARDAVSHSCGTLFCSSCWKNKKKSYSLCCSEKDSVARDFFRRNCILDLKLRCPSNHPDCPSSMTFRKMLVHLTNQCPHFKIRCQYCKDRISSCFLSDHAQCCPLKPYEAPVRTPSPKKRRLTVTAVNANETNRLQNVVLAIKDQQKQLSLLLQEIQQKVEALYMFMHNSQKLGHKICILPVGNKHFKFGYFRGPMQFNLPHGEGAWISIDGDVYVGSFLFGRPNGIGTFTFVNGCIYNGQFREGHAEGKGIYTWPNGGYFSGEFSKWFKHGFGQEFDSSGTLLYSSEFKYNIKQE